MLSSVLTSVQLCPILTLITPTRVTAGVTAAFEVVRYSVTGAAIDPAFFFNVYHLPTAVTTLLEAGRLPWSQVLSQFRGRFYPSWLKFYLRAP